MFNMTKKFGLYALLAVSALWIGCSDDNSGTSSDAGVSSDDTNTDVSTDTDSEEPGDSEVDTFPEIEECDTPTVAISENFNNWEQGDERFYMAKPDQDLAADPAEGLMIYEDNATGVSIDGHEAVMLHADAVDNSGFGHSIEGQWALDQQTNMSCEEFEISFDLYVPAALKDEAKNANVQFGLFRTSDYTPIYSKWWSGSIEADKWVTITGKINTTSGDVDYSGFKKDPNEWIFDVVRINLIINGDEAADGDEITFYLDNLRVANTPDDGTTDTDDTDVVDTEEPDGGDTAVVDTEDTEDSEDTAVVDTADTADTADTGDNDTAPDGGVDTDDAGVGDAGM